MPLASFTAGSSHPAKIRKGLGLECGLEHLGIRISLLWAIKNPLLKGAGCEPRFLKHMDRTETAAGVGGWRFSLCRMKRMEGIGQRDTT